MKKYLAILAYYTAIITISSLVGTALALYVLAHLPWMTTATMMLLTVSVVSWIDYRRATTSKNNYGENHNHDHTKTQQDQPYRPA